MFSTLLETREFRQDRLHIIQFNPRDIFNMPLSSKRISAHLNKYAKIDFSGSNKKPVEFIMNYAPFAIHR